MTEKNAISTTREALDWARKRLASGDSAAIDAEVLLRFATGWNPATLIVQAREPVHPEVLKAFFDLVEDRAAGTPVAYLTREREFWSMTFGVSPDTLIPRPDTETLVTCALERIPANRKWNVLDLGTGSGNIAISIAATRPLCDIFAVDINAGTLDIARDNARRHGTGNVTFVQGSWFAPIQDKKFELIVTNPPYIAEQDPHLQSGDIRHEPLHALISGIDGLDDITRITTDASHHLMPGGWLMLEHGMDQGDAVRNLLHRNGFQNPTTVKDLGGNDRVTIGCIE